MYSEFHCFSDNYSLHGVRMFVIMYSVFHCFSIIHLIYRTQTLSVCYAGSTQDNCVAWRENCGYNCPGYHHFT